jgi:hypothetical protein
MLLTRTLANCFSTASTRNRTPSRAAQTSPKCQFQTLALGDEKVSKAIVLKSGLGPGQKHDLTAEAAEIDAGVDLARGRERETVDHDGMDGAVAQ